MKRVSSDRRELFGTLVVAAVFAILIWLWAEGENRATATVTVEVRFMAPSGDRRFLVRAQPLDRSSNVTRTMTGVRLELEGPNSAMQRFRDAGEAISLIISDVENEASREREFDLGAAVGGLASLHRLGLSVRGVTPARVLLRVDELTRHAARVRVEAPGYEFEEVTIDPPSVAVLLPRETLDYIRPNFGDSYVVVDLTPTMLRDLKPGEDTTLKAVGVKLDPLLARTLENNGTIRSVEIDDLTVEVSLRLRGASVDEVTLLVPVQICNTPADEQVYDVVLADTHHFFGEVIVSGDPEVIRRLRNREETVWAQLILTSDELERGATSKRIEWKLPPGVTARVKGDDSGQRPLISFQIIKRGALSEEA